jgi:hypothetical protein
LHVLAVSVTSHREVFPFANSSFLSTSALDARFFASRSRGSATFISLQISSPRYLVESRHLASPVGGPAPLVEIPVTEITALVGTDYWCCYVAVRIFLSFFYSVFISFGRT